MVELPAGCWSDDTQLRLSVSRAISNHGFDVECFARIELPVWTSYALGAGRASIKAARNMEKGKQPWHVQYFPGWFNAGGNGAAMRIQPHVWSSPGLNGEYMRDVIIDSVCTHGHPRDNEIGFAVREIARRGTLADLSVFVTEIRGDLRR